MLYLLNSGTGCHGHLNAHSELNGLQQLTSGFSSVSRSGRATSGIWSAGFHAWRPSDPAVGLLRSQMKWHRRRGRWIFQYFDENLKATRWMRRQKVGVHKVINYWHWSGPGLTAVPEGRGTVLYRLLWSILVSLESREEVLFFNFFYLQI